MCEFAKSVCLNLPLSELKCSYIPELVGQEYQVLYQMEPFAVMALATSLAPNGIDIWLSGGIYMTGFRPYQLFVSNRIDNIRY